MLCTKLRADEKGPGVALHLARHPHAAEAEAPPLHLLCTRSLKNFAGTKNKPKPLRLQPEKPKRKRQNLKPVKLSSNAWSNAALPSPAKKTVQRGATEEAGRESPLSTLAARFIESLTDQHVSSEGLCSWEAVEQRLFALDSSVLREILTSHSEIVPRSKSQRVSKLVEFLSKKCAPSTGPMQPAARSPNTADRQQNKTKGSENWNSLGDRNLFATWFSLFLGWPPCWCCYMPSTGDFWMFWLGRDLWTGSENYCLGLFWPIHVATTCHWL